jgi:hypothetical protein
MSALLATGQRLAQGLLRPAGEVMGSATWKLLGGAQRQHRCALECTVQLCIKACPVRMDQATTVAAGMSAISWVGLTAATKAHMPAHGTATLALHAVACGTNAAAAGQRKGYGHGHTASWAILCAQSGRARAMVE